MQQLFIVYVREKYKIYSCHLALRPEITIFQRPLLWPSAGTASRVNEICCCTSLTLFICLFVCLFFFFFFTFTWCKGRCLWTTFGKICKILTKKTDLWNFDKGSCKSKAKLPMQIDKQATTTNCTPVSSFCHCSVRQEELQDGGSSCFFCEKTLKRPWFGREKSKNCQ